MKKYCEYKNSCIGWIGEIPEHWDIRKMKYTFTERSEKNHPDEQILCATQSQGVIPQAMYDNRVVVVNKGFENLKFVKKGDFVISLRSFQGGIEYAYYQGIISAAYTILNPNKIIDSEFGKYLLKSHQFIELLKTCVTGIREGQNINYDILRKKFLPIPPLSEQQHIVSFLDKKTAKIDEYIDKKNKGIEALKEWKKALIAHVVTKGLNTNAKMKDSGISWIGEIPEHWKVDKLGMHFRQRNEKVSDKEFPALSVSKGGVTPQLSTAVKTDNGDNRKKVCKGDFVVNSRSDRKGSCGFSSYDGSVSLINIVVTPIDLCDRYYHYLFRSNNYIEEFYRLGRGIVADLWTTRYVEMRNIMIPLPPIEEQQEIVEYIDAATTKADKMIVELTNHVESMKEYKQRLIADVVTGKINVQP
jgi:restriction endonuclease S subunit